MANLGQLQVSGNQLIGLPDLTAAKKLDFLDVASDRLTFEDLEPNAGKFSVFMYTPQAPVGESSSLDVSIGGNFTLTAEKVGGNQNRYQWFLDGQAVTDVTESNVFTVSNAISTDGGVYTCQINDLIVSGLTLEQAPITVNIPVIISSSDSLALVDLYNGTNGAHWNNHENWLTGNLATWYGITLNKGRVTQLYLYGNNLSGEISASITQLDRLQSLYVDNNQLTSLPDLSAMGRLTSLFAGNNRLTFEDLEPNLSKFYYNSYYYVPQAQIGTADSIDVATGGSFTLIAENIGGSQNRYQWFLDGQAVTEAKENKEFSVTNAEGANSGVYFCQITSSFVYGLTLYQAPITVNIPISGIRSGFAGAGGFVQQYRWT